VTRVVFCFVCVTYALSKLCRNFNKNHSLLEGLHLVLAGQTPSHPTRSLSQQCRKPCGTLPRARAVFCFHGARCRASHACRDAANELVRADVAFQSVDHRIDQQIFSVRAAPRSRRRTFAVLVTVSVDRELFNAVVGLLLFLAVAVDRELLNVAV
jgi:hypothetical protein